MTYQGIEKEERQEKESLISEKVSDEEDKQ
jgi:hypothetical protein